MRHNRLSQRIRQRIHHRSDRGAALVTVMLIGVVLSAVAAVSISNALADMNRATAQLRRSTALQAAEAGVADYLSKLAEDHAYYLHIVHPAESTRNNGAGLVAAAGANWDGNSTTWTYPTPNNAWRALPNAADGTPGNGYEYNLQITAPTELSPIVTIISTGRKRNSTRDIRRLEVAVRPASLADYLMVSNRDITYSSAATTAGKIYAGTDESVGCSSGGRHCGGQHVNHGGTAKADVLAEGQVQGATTFIAPARSYDSDSNPTIRSTLPNQILFSSFVNSLIDIRAAASLPTGILLDDNTVDAWRLQFKSNGTIDIFKCTKTGGLDPGEAAPTCIAAGNRPVPANGAVFVQQTAILDGVVDGQLSVVTKGNAVIGANLTYELRGNDVLGIISENNLLMAGWSPNSLTVEAAMIARSGQYRSWTGTKTKTGTFTHWGSVATFAGGFMSMFNPRVYTYDTNLQFLQPPYYPTLGDDYVIRSYRELVPPNL